jgi:hypothetical protein
METKYGEKEFCPKCRKPLQAATCPACGGKRYHRQLLIAKRLCLRCQGTGREYQCYFQLSHDEDELRALKQQRVDEWIRSYGQSAMY